jgi:hypothetical protein
VAAALEGKGSIVLLHDGGGDRSETIAALPALISELRRNGFKLVLVGDLIGRTRDQVMPPVAGQGYWQSFVDAVAFNSVNVVESIVSALFLIAIVLGLGRLVFIGSAAIGERIWRRERPSQPFPDPVAVIVPAYNEEKVIVQTVRSILRSVNVPGLQILVVDDGSTDATAARIKEEFGSEPRVTLYERANGGKASALNFGLHQAKAESSSPWTRTRSSRRRRLRRSCGTSSIRRLARSRAMPRWGIASTCSRSGRRSSTSRARTSIAARSTCWAASRWCQGPWARGAGSSSWTPAGSRAPRWPRTPTSR